MVDASPHGFLVEVEFNGSVAVLHCPVNKNSLTQDDVRHLCNLAEEMAVNAPTSEIIIDMTPVMQIAAEAVMDLGVLHQHLSQANVQLQLVNVTPDVYEQLEVSQVCEMFEIQMASKPPMD